MNERSIFLAALELADPRERQKYLDQACFGNHKLREQVEELLISHNQASDFLEQPPAGLVAMIAGAADETAGESPSAESLEFLERSDKPGCLGTLSQYEVVNVVGRGGMGIVLRAYDTKLNRVVAIKVMAPELAANSMAVKRFLREARAAAAVCHDHVVTIHAIEDDNRPPYIVMEFIDGPSLQEKIDRQGSLDVMEVLRIGMQMARGLAAAHEQGLVHRDIKPANILLENGVERVKLTDFGLARAVDDVSVTQMGQIAGTPQFMSPEQAQGHAIDARSDLFSLGSVLYTMCTGRPPFRADNAIAMLRRVTDDNPRSICEVNADIPDWLEAIVFKLLVKDPDDRFQSAQEVAELMSRHLAHLQHPATAARPPRIYAQKPQPTTFDLDEELGFIETTLRIYAWVAAAWAIFGILFGATVSLFPGNYTATFFKLNAPWSLVTGILSLVTCSLSFVGMSHVRRRESYRRSVLGNIAALLPVNPFLLMAVPWSICSIIKLRNPKVRTAFRRAKPPTRTWIKVETSLAIVSCLALVLVAGIVIYIQTDYGTLVIESESENSVVTIGKVPSDTHEGFSFSVVDKLTGSGVVRLRSGHYRVLAFDVSNNDAETQFELSKEQLVLRRGGKVIIKVTRKKRLGKAVASQSEIALAKRIFTGPMAKAIFCLAVSRDGRRALTGSYEGAVCLWDVQTGALIGSLERHGKCVRQVAFSPDRRHGLSGAEDGTIRLWDLETGNQIRHFNEAGARIMCVAFAPDGKTFATGSWKSWKRSHRPAT